MRFRVWASATEVDHEGTESLTLDSAHLLAAGSDHGEYEGFVGSVLSLMESLGEVGVGIAVLVEQFAPPIPSEALLPVAGFLAHDGRMSFVGAWLLASLGAIVGAWIWYWIGAALGRERTRTLVSKVPLMEGEDFDKADAFFAKWGTAAVLFGRCVPLVRSFISIPAGVQRMNFWFFTLYTAIGTLVWNGLWIGLGFAFGPAIEPVLEQWSGVISNAVVVVIGALLAALIGARLWRNAARKKAKASA